MLSDLISIMSLGHTINKSNTQKNLTKFHFNGLPFIGFTDLSFQLSSQLITFHLNILSAFYSMIALSIEK